MFTRSREHMVLVPSIRTKAERGDAADISLLLKPTKCGVHAFYAGSKLVLAPVPIDSNSDYFIH